MLILSKPFQKEMKFSLFNSAVIAVIFTAQNAQAVNIAQADSRDLAGIYGVDLLSAAQTMAETDSHAASRAQAVAQAEAEAEDCPKCEMAK